MSKADEQLRQFLAVPKPAWAIPTDVSCLCVLIACQNEPYPGHSVISARVGLSAVDVKSLMRSLKRLEAAGWVVKQDGGYKVCPDKFPKAEDAAKST